jgi:transposase
MDRRKVFTGILFVLKTGIPWEMLPQEMGCGSRMTCWRYLQKWQKQGVWQKIHEVLLAKLREAEAIDWSRTVVDSALVRAVFGGAKTGSNPTDRRKAGSKHHLITHAKGIPLVAILTGANTHDVTQLLPLVDGIPPTGGKVGRPRHRPKAVQGDRGYDSEPHRKELRARRIKPILAKRGTPHGSGPGVYRWVVERTLSWLHQFRRLRIRFERLSEIHEAFLSLGCILICWRYLNQLSTSFC